MVQMGTGFPFSVDASSLATAGQIWSIRDFPCPVGSETNVSLPHRKLNKDLDCGSVRLEIDPILTFVIAHFTAFSKTL